jgi:hypothetical protein
MSSKGKMYLSKCKMTPNTKKYITINFIQLIHKTCLILCTFINQCLSPASLFLGCLIFTFSAFIFLTLVGNIPNLVSITSRHVIITIYYVGYTALIKPFTATSGKSAFML